MCCVKVVLFWSCLFLFAVPAMSFPLFRSGHHSSSFKPPLFLSTLSEDSEGHTVQSSKSILVIGATGLLGSHVVQKLIQRNIPYRCFVRTSSPNFDRIQNLPGGRVFEGDLANYKHLEAAVCSDGGIGGCICVSGSFRKRKVSDIFRLGKRNIKDTSHPYLVNHVGMEHLCRAINVCNDNQEMGRHIKIVKVSGILISLPKWHPVTVLGNIIYSGVIRWHKAGEQDIIKSGINYTILRPGSFRDEKEYGYLKDGLAVVEDGALPTRLKVSKPVIGLEDLAEICIDCLDSSTDMDCKIMYPRWLLSDKA